MKVNIKIEILSSKKLSTLLSKIFKSHEITGQNTNYISNESQSFKSELFKAENFKRNILKTT